MTKIEATGIIYDLDINDDINFIDKHTNINVECVGENKYNINVFFNNSFIVEICGLDLKDVADTMEEKGLFFDEHTYTECCCY